MLTTRCSNNPPSLINDLQSLNSLHPLPTVLATVSDDDTSAAVDSVASEADDADDAVTPLNHSNSAVPLAKTGVADVPNHNSRSILSSTFPSDSKYRGNNPTAKTGPGLKSILAAGAGAKQRRGSRRVSFVTSAGGQPKATTVTAAGGQPKATTVTAAGGQPKAVRNRKLSLVAESKAAKVPSVYCFKSMLGRVCDPPLVICSLDSVWSTNTQGTLVYVHRYRLHACAGLECQKLPYCLYVRRQFS